MVVVAVEIVMTVGVGADMSPSQCKEERRLLVNACRPVIFGRSPSPDYCQRVRVIHVECVCPVVFPKFAALINVQRTIKQIQGCGRAVPHNFKCGKVFPPDPRCRSNSGYFASTGECSTAKTPWYHCSMTMIEDLTRLKNGLFIYTLSVLIL